MILEGRIGRRDRQGDTRRNIESGRVEKKMIDTPERLPGRMTGKVGGQSRQRHIKPEIWKFLEKLKEGEGTAIDQGEQRKANGAGKV